MSAQPGVLGGSASSARQPGWSAATPSSAPEPSACAHPRRSSSWASARSRAASRSELGSARSSAFRCTKPTLAPRRKRAAVHERRMNTRDSVGREVSGFTREISDLRRRRARAVDFRVSCLSLLGAVVRSGTCASNVRNDAAISGQGGNRTPTAERQLIYRQFTHAPRHNMILSTKSRRADLIRAVRLSALADASVPDSPVYT